MTLYAVGHVVDELKQRYATWPRVVEYLDAVQRDVIENADDFRKPDEEPSPMARLMQQEEPSLRRYQVNVLIDHVRPDGSPVVYLDHPSLQNLVGRIDHARPGHAGHQFHADQAPARCTAPTAAT